MGDKQEKCKAQGCGNCAGQDVDSDYCSQHQCKLDPISALYVDKTDAQIEADEKLCGFFSYLLHNRVPEELF